MAGLSIDDDRVLFFPVTPFDPAGRIDLDAFDEHVRSRLAFVPGAVFAACGTGEYHALSVDEYRQVVGRAVAAVAGAIPVVSGAGGPLGHAIQCARAAAAAGADALLVMPPYLVGGPQSGLVAYVTELAAETDLDIVVYHRDNARFDSASVEQLFGNPKVAGLKDGVGDLANAQRFVRAAVRSGRDDLCLFNGLLTAELSQAAYDGIGIRHYSSALFAMAPDIANRYLAALRGGDRGLRGRLLDEFFEPLVALRDRVPGYAVAMIKAGVRLDGLAAGPVRPPLVDLTPEHTAILADLLDHGRAIA